MLGWLTAPPGWRLSHKAKRRRGLPSRADCGHRRWAGMTLLSPSGLQSAPTFSCELFILVFGRFSPTLIKAQVSWAKNESGWPKASCTSFTSTLSWGNYASYNTEAQDWTATTSGPTVMHATNSRSGGQLLGWWKNHLVCQEMLSRGRHKVQISGWGALLASFCKKDISKGDFFFKHVLVNLVFLLS